MTLPANLSKELLKEREFTSQLVNALPYVFVSLDKQGHVVSANNRMLELLGCSAAELQNSDFCGRFVVPEDREAFRKIVGSVRPGRAVRSQARLMSTEGDAHISWHATAGRKPPHTRLLLLVGEDITAQKKAQDALRAGEEYYRLLVDNLQEVMWLFDTDDRIVFVNRSVQKLTGFSPEELIGRPLFDYIHPADLEKVKRNLVLRRQGLQGQYDFRIKTRQGYSWVNVKTSPVMDGRQMYRGAVACCVDVTERKLHEQEEELLIGLLQIINFSGDRRSLLKNAIECIREKLGFDAVGVRLREGFDFPYYESSGFAGEFVERETNLCADEAGRLECLCGDIIAGSIDHSKPSFTRNGSFWTNSSSDMIASMNGAERGRYRAWCNAAGYESIALVPLRAGKECLGLLQINDRERGRFTPRLLVFLEQIALNLSVALNSHLMKEKIERSEERYRTLAENLPGGFVCLFDHSLRCIVAQGRSLEHCGLSSEQMVGKHVEDIFPDGLGEHTRACFFAALSGVPAHFEAAMCGRSYDMYLVPVKDETGKVERGLLIGRDVSEFKRSMAELSETKERIEASLREKEVLLKELNHRVKNNLQVVSSLLNLQMRYVHSAEDVGIFKDCQNRIRSMVLVHENLYMADNVANVGFGAYVRKLASNLFSSFGETGSRVTLSAEIQEGVSVGLDQAIPCGLIINELITNSLKYAFGDKDGCVSVKFKETPQGYCLCVRDDGKGVPSGLDLKDPPTLGMQLVVTLVEQLRGSISLDTAQGTAFRIEFPHPAQVLNKSAR